MLPERTKNRSRSFDHVSELLQEETMLSLDSPNFRNNKPGRIRRFGSDPSETTPLLGGQYEYMSDGVNSPAWATVINPLKEVPKSSIKAAVFSLVASMVGGGTLSIPFAFQEAGIIGGSILMLFVGGISVYSCGVLVSCTRHSSKKFSTFAELAGE